ncbi:MAG TPA: hypothetical protein VF223_15940 [Trebonia sp.]
MADFDASTPSIARVYDYFLGAAADRFFNLYNKGPAPLYKHSAEDFASFFGDLPLLPPGIADARSWRPGWPMVSVPPKREGEMIVGVAQTP